ncbi:MAG: sugar ABC transporter permease [Chloroflexi bacterium]|nr:sugar ABC transporter permease [Chloroflexota bacterium]MDA0243839.1 sugar ABC transporter permease [Chloroflexota bacterium]
MNFLQNRFKWTLRYQGQLYAFLVPYLVGTFVLVVVPALATAVLAFTEFKGVEIPQWVGFRNFVRVIESPLIRLSLYNTFMFVAAAVPLRLIGALLLALLLQQKGRLFGLYRAAVYLPTIIPEVAYALIWLWIFNPVYGPLNIFLRALGLPAPDWLVNEDTARFAFVILATFQIGEGFIVLLVGLQNIPRSLYEAAEVDGANWWQAFWRITLPLLMPWLLLLTFRDLLMSIQETFTPSYVMTYGGPYYATTFVPLLIYEISFDYQDLGLATALLFLTFMIVAFIIMVIMSVTGLSGEADDV